MTQTLRLFDLHQGLNAGPLIHRDRHLSDLRPADILLGTILHQMTRSVRHITAYVEAMELYSGSPSPGPLAAAFYARLRNGTSVAQAGILT